jgi:hypothetical protein
MVLGDGPLASDLADPGCRSGLVQEIDLGAADRQDELSLFSSVPPRQRDRPFAVDQSSEVSSTSQLSRFATL